MMMESGLWSRLPKELLECALPYLPVRDLSRFRSVCKRWNSLICTPEFGTLNCVQNHASTTGGASFVFTTRAYNPRTGADGIQSWSIFDLNARRWYNVKHELPEDYNYGMRTMDGGLVCTCVNAFTDEQRRTSTIIDNLYFTTPLPQTLIVSNLLGGTIKVLPNPPLVCIQASFINLKLVVDKKSHRYKVFLVGVKSSHGIFHITSDDPCMCVYESCTNQWRIAPTPRSSNDLYQRFVPDVHHSAWFQGLLYVFWAVGSPYGLSNFPGELPGQLFSYNFMEDAWEDTGLHFPDRKIPFLLQNVCDLVVSDNRLFLMTRHSRREYQTSKDPGQFAWLLDISEIFVAEKTLRTVVRLSPAQVYQNFSIKPDGYLLHRIRAFGYGRSILLIFEYTGEAIEYNFVTGSWETLPPNPVESPNFQPTHVPGHGKLMSGSLRLPNTPL